MCSMHVYREVAVALANEAVFMMLVGTDNSAYMLAQCMIFLHQHPQWLAAMNDEQVRLQAEYGPGMGREVRTNVFLGLLVTEISGRLFVVAATLSGVAGSNTATIGLNIVSLPAL